MDFFKAATFGAALSVIVAVVIGSQGTSGGALAVQSFVVDGTRLYWSWPLFFSGTGLAWVMMLMQR